MFHFHSAIDSILRHHYRKLDILYRDYESIKGDCNRYLSFCDSNGRNEIDASCIRFDDLYNQITILLSNAKEDRNSYRPFDINNILSELKKINERLKEIRNAAETKFIEITVRQVLKIYIMRLIREVIPWRQISAAVACHLGIISLRISDYIWYIRSIIDVILLCAGFQWRKIWWFWWSIHGSSYF